MFLAKRNQCGATMVEAIGVLTVVVMLGVGSIKLVGNLYSIFKQSLVVNELKDLQKNISGRYKFEGNYKELFENKTPEETSKFLCDNKMAPYQMCIDGLLYNRMGGEVWILPFEKIDASGNSYDDYTKYSMIFSGLTDRACAELAQTNWYMQKKSDVYQMIINYDTENELVVDLPYNQQNESKIFPVVAQDVMSACHEDDNNQIEWVFF